MLFVRTRRVLYQLMKSLLFINPDSRLRRFVRTELHPDLFRTAKIEILRVNQNSMIKPIVGRTVASLSLNIKGIPLLPSWRSAEPSVVANPELSVFLAKV